MAKTFAQEYGGRAIGCIEDDGKVYAQEYGGIAIGRVEGSSTRMGGAALLLLLS